MSKKIFSAAVPTAASDACGHDSVHGHVLTIEAVARMFKMPTWRLRFYEWRGLIRRGRDGNDAVYSWHDCERIALIVKANKAALTLRQIAPVVKAMSDTASSDALRAGHRCCSDLINGTTEYSDAVADILAELERVRWELAKRISGACSRNGLQRQGLSRP